MQMDATMPIEWGHDTSQMRGVIYIGSGFVFHDIIHSMTLNKSIIWYALPLQQYKNIQLLFMCSC